MRTICPLAGMVLLLASVQPAAAQNILGNSTPLQFKTIDTSTALKPPSLSNFKVIGMAPRSPLTLPKLSLTPPRWPGSGGSAPILTTPNNPFQPNPPSGINLFLPRATKN